MSDHNFEKEIQQKLGDLKVTPAGSVWASVEAQIRKDRTRRRGFIILPLLLLLLGGGLYYMFESKTLSTGITKTTADNTQPSSQKHIRTREKSSQSTNDQNSTPDLKQNKSIQPATGDQTTLPTSDADPLPGNNTPENRALTPARQNAGSPTLPDNNIADSDGSITVTPKRNNTVSGGERLVASNNTRVVQKDRNAVAADKKNLDTNRQEVVVSAQIPEKKVHNRPPALDEQDEKERGIASDSAVVNNTKDLSTKPDSGEVQQATAQKVLDSVTAAPDAVAKSPDPKAKTSKFKYGVTASIGISNVVDGGLFHGIFGGILGTEKSLMADMASQPANYNGGTPQAIIYTPSAIRKGVSYSVGAFMEKSLSKRFSISAGLQYHYYSTKIKVGTQGDTATVIQNAFGLYSVRNYYRANPGTTTYEYTNRFHFAEVPILLNFKIIKSSRFPVYANAGGSVLYLFSTNALHFDSRTGVYYEDDGLFNRLHGNLSGGFSIGLRNSSKLPIQIGPQFSYGLNKLMKQEASSSKRPVHFGLNAKFFLKN